MNPIIGVLAHRGLRLQLAAGLVSLTGDWVLRVGLAYSVYGLTGSTLASALLLLASFVPQIVLGSLAGVFVDRWDLKRTMVVSNLLLAIGLLPLLAVHAADRVWVVYFVVAWEGCVQQFFAPAEQSLLPHLVDDSHLVTANALNGQNANLSRLLGSALGGAVVAAGGVGALALADMASFLIAAVLVARLPSIGLPERATGPFETSLERRLANLREQWRDGLRVSTRNRVLRVIVVFLLVTSVGEGIMGTLFAPFVHSVLHGSATAYGLIVSTQAIGGIAGALLVAWIGDRLHPAGSLGWSALCFGVVDLVLFLYPTAWHALWPAAACMIVAGFPGAVMFAGAMTLLQRNTTDTHRGRVFGALSAVEGVAVVTGTLLAGLLGQAVGIVPVLVTQAVGYLAAGTMVLLSLRHRPG